MGQMWEKLGRALIVLLALALVGVAVSVTLLVAQTWRELEGYQAREADLRARLAKAEAELEQREAYLKALLEDPAVLERVVRERLGYAKPGELIFRFDEPGATP